MKRMIIAFAAFVCVWCASFTAVSASELPNTQPGLDAVNVNASANFRAAWVAAAYNLDFPSKKGLSPSEMKKEIDGIVDRAVALRLNALIVQVRPASDALYPSALFPWSEMLTGTQGTAPANGFDPLAYWVEKGHAAGLEIHAWINPFRITYAGQKITDVKKLSASHPARQNPSWAIAYKDALYLDPGRPECRQLIADGVAEILSNYAVDGIHMDDYFYPGTDFPDNTSYLKFGGGADRDEWRRENINAMVQLLQKTVRELKPGTRFGASPTAIWMNKSSDTRGSDTRGFESYKSAYADTRRWVKEGWLDYICPQIYWYAGFAAADFETVLSWWEEVCKGTAVDLYVGHAAYKEVDPNADWLGGEIVRQLARSAQSSVVKGSVFYRMASLDGSVGDGIRNFYAAQNTATITQTVPTEQQLTVFQPAAVAMMDKLSVAQPSDNLSVTDGKGYNIFGTCQYDKPLYVNGQLITTRAAEGYFNYYAPLKKGDNSFTFTQEGQPSVTRVITLKDVAVTHPPTLKTAALSNVYPTSDEMGSPGDTVTLKCTAPAGAKVTVRLGGKTITLTQDNSSITNHGSTIYAANYSGVYTLPAGNASARADLGRPAYSMEFNGKKQSETAKGSVVVLTDAPYYATVSADSTWVYPNANTKVGSSWQIERGQKDRVTAVTANGEWVKLACGGWVEAKNVTCQNENALPADPISGGVYQSGVNEDIIRWKASVYPAVYAEFDGKQLTLRFGLQKNAPGHTIDPAGTMLESIHTDQAGYVLTIKDGVKLEGYYVDYANGELRLHLKKRKALSMGSLPLSGFKFVVDAGHGQTESGAIGPLGKDMLEKDINLANALKLTARLRALGAEVTLTRGEDKTLTLYERTEISRKTNPDMFISIHGNSMAESTNSNEIRGLTVWYRNALSKSLAGSLGKDLLMINPRSTRRPDPNQSDFYVCRPSWTPSVIIEASFLCNAEDFAWMVNADKQNELAYATADAIINYYR